MPTFLFIFGLRFYFYSEEHLPIHVHVQKENRGIKPKDIKRAAEAVALYKEDIIRVWNEYFDE